ncbi:NADH-ubiquinone oxidoreductase-F iron-sulfur binding region domain-containing protein [Candidatus Colwellia aromaticivorans]|uniref:NADH-ubiquinone oxidoreductase-F iron-sulfur binding region domain-containing protein n=1 Tax=Candidatus Colwellia aromaticivorans TaxID=2267621 RepID=UPI000DF3EDF8|nr:NADH-ubiquinone oxidoreductase-F iron-sulfur binding region domain-containing protein [Candidatus Colwellia aromaticivorans]
MSKNLSQLARRQGIDNTLFQQLIFSDSVGSTSVNSTDALKHQRQVLAKEFLMGEAVVHGAASFYDFIDDGTNEHNANKKAYVCNGSSCLCANTQATVKETLVAEFGAENVGHVTCLGRCAENSAFQVNGNNFSGSDIDKVKQIIGEANTASNENYQVRTTLAEPILTAEISDVAKYYQLFEDLSKQYQQQQLLEKLVGSGLRGRGGAGFPTGIKWRSALTETSAEKYIVCNADEGDAGAFSDRYLLEHRPHAVLFGMLMAGLLTGARTGVLYIRAEYPEAIKQTEQAISEFEQLILDEKISAGFSFKIIKGAGAYICGEETALLRSIEGQRPVVSVRPPFPTQSGLFGCPTVVNNVETFASIHFIFSDLDSVNNSGVDKYKTLGNGKSTGSKLLSLDGAFVYPGIIEVAMGTTLTKVIELAGGFVKDIKALHIGGPLGGVVPLAEIDKLTIDFESFSDNGFLLGHASIIGIPQSMKMIDYIAHLFEFTALESCGKCYPCQIGSVRGQEMFEQAITGKQPINSELLSDLLETMQLGSLCALGGGVPLPINNILQYFEDEVSPYFLSKQSTEIGE